MEQGKTLTVKKRNGRLEEFNAEKVNKVAQRACSGLEDVTASELVLDAKIKLYDKVPTESVDLALIEAASAKIPKDPNWSFVAARLSCNCLYKEIFKDSVSDVTFVEDYRSAFVRSLKKGVKEGFFDERLLDFDLKKISNAIEPIRDEMLTLAGIKNLRQKYLFKINGKIIETPQAFWMRVAMGLCINEKNKEDWAIRFYNNYSNFLASASTPTLFNSGTLHSQTASCFGSVISDDANSIGYMIWQNSRMSKYAGGLGIDLTPLRASNSHIKSTNGVSSGPIPFIKMIESMIAAFNQGGKRAGSACVYMEPWHLDIRDFMELRKATGDEWKRTHKLNTAIWYPDEFFNRLKRKEDWYLFDPKETPELHESYGEDFNKKYAVCIKRAENGEIKFVKLRAIDLWNDHMKLLFSTSHPWITFKDAANMRYSNIHEGIIHNTQLCTEIFLHNKATKLSELGDIIEHGETYVCQLSSINGKYHVEDGKINWNKLAETTKTTVRAIDNAIDINFYPTHETLAHLKHRPIALGFMGFQDVCYALGIKYDSEQGVELAGKIQEFVSYHAILASSELAKERGKYQTYEGSLWSKGIFPQDTYISLMEYRGQSVPKLSEIETLDWSVVRNHVKEFGMRNSNTQAIAPTAGISYIHNCEQSIEPTFECLVTYENDAGTNYNINAFQWLKLELKKRGLWSSKIGEALLRGEVGGNIKYLDLPQEVKELFASCWDRDMGLLIDAAAKRQIWIDMGQSMNVYYSGSVTKDISNLYKRAWEKGLKSTYYFRNKSASAIKKIEDSPLEYKEGAVCTMEEGCIVCQ